VPLSKLHCTARLRRGAAWRQVFCSWHSRIPICRVLQFSGYRTKQTGSIYTLCSNAIGNLEISHPCPPAR
jgi:hypothetical protein